MVYGGRAGGVDNADLIYVASENPNKTGEPVLRLRRENKTNTLVDFDTFEFSTLSSSGYGGSLIKDMEIDPDDWRRGYVLDDTGKVFRFEDAGAKWTEITKNLTSFVDDVRAIELFTPTSAAGDDVVLVSGFGGVYRLNPGSNAEWTSFGGNLPNAVTRDIVYNEPDDVLIVGTYGRGATQR
jgi:hypothetical protein